MVLGHCANPYINRSMNIRALYTWIYLLHMPLFVFLSGMFSHKMTETGIRLKQRVVGYIMLAFLLKFTVLAVQLLFGKMKAFHMKIENGVPWYLFCLAGWLVLTWALRKVPRRFLLFFSVIFACFVGYDKDVAGTFALSHYFVYYPFFLAGTLWNPDRAEPKQGRWLWKAAALVLVGASVLLVFRHIGFVFRYIDLIRGWKSYFSMEKQIGITQVHLGFFLRLMWYGTTGILSAAVIILMPSRRSILTGVGQRSLQVYLYHRPILYAMLYAGLDTMTKRLWPAHWHLLYLCGSILLAFLLALPVLERPLRWFWKQLEQV